MRLLSLVLCNVHAETTSVSHIEHQWIIDKHGRQRLFRGINVVYKAFPFHPILDKWDPQFSFTREDVDFIADLNLNIIRLGVMWGGVEPWRGSYNQTYIDVLKQIVARCQEKGIYVLLDMHQDVLSERFCGEGVPMWAFHTNKIEQEHGFPFPLENPWPLNQSDDIPTKLQCDTHEWFSYQLTAAASRGYQNLYDDEDGLATSMARFWAKVASEFKDYDNVVGYDLINEPWAGDVFKNPLLLSPGVADRKNLQPFYEIIHEHIRQVDTDRLIFFESVTWDNFVVGFTQPPGGKEYRNRSVLSYHHYDKKPNMLGIERTFTERLLDAKRLSTGLMMTEFDIAFGDGKRAAWLENAFRLADKHFQSWIGWEYKRFVPITGFGDFMFDPQTGELVKGFVPLLSRPFAQAIAGRALSMSFDPETKQFDLEYELIQSSRTSVTEIRFLKRVQYPNGFQVKVKPSKGITWEVSPHNDGLVLVRADPRAPLGERVHVSIIEN
ncbi:glycoside hydrolase superfamily [Polychytrium aggregatum]|uniref:glycoside hydrolase superfamily n=1 Tax=Polychytrium aggregatum TaxID=110093 RepID=UPI0022FDF0F1|nr:glycoside hydrolase superfamily [Polychytrium aggregatum]KAI9206222.1 glycoside hydrolase superfamily [Polychytrium aggregatum]